MGQASGQEQPTGRAQCMQTSQKSIFARSMSPTTPTIHRSMINLSITRKGGNRRKSTQLCGDNQQPATRAPDQILVLGLRTEQTGAAVRTEIKRVPLGAATTKLCPV